MTKRHLFKTSILAGLAAVCPVMAAAPVQKIDVSQWTHFEAFGYKHPTTGYAYMMWACRTEDFEKSEHLNTILADPEAVLILENRELQTRVQISREQFKQLFNI